MGEGPDIILMSSAASDPIVEAAWPVDGGYQCAWFLPSWELAAQIVYRDGLTAFDGRRLAVAGISHGWERWGDQGL
jgi:hypothetical protein